MKINIIIDGSWLFKIQSGVLKSRRVESEQHRPVLIDFGKLSNLVRSHVQQHTGKEFEFGERHCCISVFNVPTNVDSWNGKTISQLQPNIKGDNFLIEVKDLEIVLKQRDLRDKFANNALASGFERRSVLRPDLKPWMIKSLKENQFQEKMVDSTVVALLVASAITKPDEFHAVVAGDADILPAIKIAYPQYSKNVFIVSTHPHQLRAEHRQSSFSYLDEEFGIPALYLQDWVQDIIKGNYPVKCASCGGVFENGYAVPKKQLPYCLDCRKKASRG